MSYIHKTYQPAITVEEQICNLKNIGLIVNNEEYAEKVLNKVSYYRLVKAFSLHLKDEIIR